MSIPNSHFADSSRGNPRGETGVFELDSSLDRNIGRDADNRWEIVKDRTSEKDKLHLEAQRMTGNPKAKMALKRDPVTGEYQPMAVSEVSANVGLQIDFKQARSENGLVDTVNIPSKRTP